MAKKEIEEIYYCTMQLDESCNNKKGVLKKGDFYISTNPVFFKNGRMHVCKACIKEFCYVDGVFSIERFKNILMLLDLPFLNKEFESALADKGETIGVYIKNLYLNHKGKVANDSDSGLGNLSNKNSEINDFEVTKEMFRVWGRGKTPEDYEWLEETYKEWTTKYKSDTLSEQKTFRFLTLKELEIMKGREEGKNVDKQEETYRKFMSDANVVPRDATASMDSEKQNVFSLWIKEVEKYKPAEYFEDKSIYEDFDGIKEYLNRFVYRPLKNLLTGSREFDIEYNVENEDIGDIESEDEENSLLEEEGEA